MSKHALIAAVAIAGAVAAVWAVFNRPADAPGIAGESLPPHEASDSPSADAALVTVKAIMEHPEKYAGMVRLEGVVAQVDEEQRLFMLMSRQDWAACGTTKCCVPLMLPVRGTGAPPATEAVVSVEGRVELTDGKYVLAADSFDRLER